MTSLFTSVSINISPSVSLNNNTGAGLPQPQPKSLEMSSISHWPESWLSDKDPHTHWLHSFTYGRV